MESGNAYTAWSYGWRIESWEHGEMGVHNGKSLFELNYFIEDIKCDFKKLKWLMLERSIFIRLGSAVRRATFSANESTVFLPSPECYRKCSISCSFFPDISVLSSVTDKNINGFTLRCDIGLSKRLTRGLHVMRTQGRVWCLIFPSGISQ